ncbi:hypothetical protein LWC34_28085 [Kibdelosporangium philippinense]|uniref:Uncharacterized protein n=1 Tax=Kibdelosporangium philippinense TaxID=211113 RepID=A0ABS8ZFR7_9PSEU|nr:hypothetical protein [Kibdelosporangium philippinense]MCE7006659.1 hypothetical protein [Kibdelosporangium philippinense]
MRKALILACSVLALSLATGGIAAADPIWVLPGVDLGGVLAPTTGLPQAIAPVFDLLKLVGG